MILEATAPFELRGEFCGFIRTLEGKRRLLLRNEDGGLQLKVPSELRHHLARRLERGQPIVVSGLDIEESGGRHRRVVLHVHGKFGIDEACLSCPIRVCAKKNCWKRGGRALWEALAAEIAALGGVLTLERGDCLDRCDEAPNLDCGAFRFERCKIEPARQFLHLLESCRVVGQASRLPPGASRPTEFTAGGPPHEASGTPAPLSSAPPPGA